MKIVIIFSVAIVLISCSGQMPQTGLEGKMMPSFNLLLMDSSTTLSTNKIPNGEPIVFFFISPYCPYCKAQTEEIIANMKSFTNIRFYILSNFSFQSLKDYYDHYQLNKYPNVSVGQDYKSYFPSYFKVSSVPYLALFTKEKILKQVFIGKVDVNLIKDISLN